MKHLTIFIGLGLIFTTALKAEEQSSSRQTPSPLAEISRQAYMKDSKALLSNEGETVQKPYEAYDWEKARLKRLALERYYHHMERMEAYKHGCGWHSWPYNNARPCLFYQPYGSLLHFSPMSGPLFLAR